MSHHPLRHEQIECLSESDPHAVQRQRDVQHGRKQHATSDSEDLATGDGDPERQARQSREYPRGRQSHRQFGCGSDEAFPLECVNLNSYGI